MNMVANDGKWISALRANAFRHLGIIPQLQYIDWIIANAETTPWCMEIVQAYTENQLGINE